MVNWPSLEFVEFHLGLVNQYLRQFCYGIPIFSFVQGYVDLVIEVQKISLQHWIVLHTLVDSNDNEKSRKYFSVTLGMVNTL